ncbi:hypothetical protein [Rhodoferax sp.]|uniref:hypothetical protein n=1 Tax=Rhodoferax sp. TaxID=50421 RepID=UPI00276E1F33|nr:hypothetical protein [Rhodoferax sp.]
MTRFKSTREANIRRDYREILRDDSLGVLVLANETGDVVQAFAGRRPAPDFHEWFRNKERADRYVQTWYARLQDWARRRHERRESLRNAPTPLQLGDILKSSWGLERANVAYYQVTAVRCRAVVVCEIEAEVVRVIGEATGNCTPVPDRFIGVAMRKRVDARGVVNFNGPSRWAYRIEFTMVDGLRVFDPDDFTT